MRPPRDALIEGGYLDDYPRNPFLRPGDGVNTVIFKTGASYTLGDGDVRFGWDGERMGNLLDDPRYLFNNGRPTRLEWTMYPIPAAYLGVINPNSPNTYYTFGGLPEWSREENGQSDPAGGKIQYWWPGEFFYRSGGTFVADNPFSGPQEDTGSTIWGWPYKRIDKYMLGGYGSLRSEGLDVIRLTTLDGSAACTQAGTMNGVVEGQYYQDPRDPSRKASHPEFEIQVQYSNPEVFGGGEQGLMPQFPYYQAGNHRWIYGAPDGYPDGIVLVLTNEDRAQE
jgi:hypothetical protein